MFRRSWEGTGTEEVGKDKATGVVRVRVNARFYRPTEVVSRVRVRVMVRMGKDKATGVVRLRVNARFYRPTEVLSSPAGC